MKRTYWIVLFLIIIGVLFSACGNAGQVDATETPEKVNALATIQALSAQTTLVPPTPMGGVAVEGPDDYVGIIKQAWNIIDTEYVRDNFNGADWPAIYDEYIVLAEDVTSSEELWNLLGEMVGELDDSHSRHVPPDRMTAEFGIDTAAAGEARAASGIEIWPGPSREDEFLTVWNVCAQSVAAQAGITRGDIITAIDGNPVVKEGDDFKREDRTAVIFGNAGDQVTLTVWQGPNQDPVDITLTLDGVGGCPYRYHEVVLEDPRIGYIRVPDFDGDSAFTIFESIKALEEEQPLEGLIMDVRHNPGGNSDDSVAIFTEGIVGTVGKLREGEQRTIFRIRGPVEWNETTPVVVLTDGSSHSAADYFPAAMKELGRATIVGMNSAGNTEGITGWSLADGTLIRLAVMTMALNDGTVLEGIGVTPDVIVPLGTWGLKAEPFDLQIQAGIDTLLEMIQ
ncbi:MAG: PDZ domain-containing protein [Anaerolineales bacterium]|nr:PDZ domain-containing protein [Anaerolineales bacterium]